MTKKSISITNLYSSISTVSCDAVLNQLQLSNLSLRNYLRDLFLNQNDSTQGFLAEPIIEATFGWKPADNNLSMTELSNSGFLSKELVSCMDGAYAPDTEKQKKIDLKASKTRFGYAKDIDEDYTWPKERPPYLHQLDAWKSLRGHESKSTVVTSGTGSGKTECFLVPLLNDLAEQVENSNTPLIGVQAIMLYPLNALINSQQERLSAWTRGFNGKVKYALYTGETDENPTTKSHTAIKSPSPEKLMSRSEIRDTPPPILVTNSTILEYMLVRPVDRDILQKSQGKLRWIILDEAHTLVGTQAAEISLLLRRTMLAFDVKPEDVRFIATSATIGDAKDWVETEKKLKEFLAGLAGIRSDQVNVVKGERLVPELPLQEVVSDYTVSQLANITSGEVYSALCQMQFMINLRHKLSLGPLAIGDIAKVFYPNEQNISYAQKSIATQMIDIANDAYPNGDSDKESFLPVRVHLFHRAQRGLWACINPECIHKEGTHLANDWPFGKVFVEERLSCLDGCKSPVYELTHCKECKEPSLSAIVVSDEKGNRITIPREHDEVDEYFDDIEYFDEDSDEVLEPKKQDNVQLFSSYSNDTQRYSLSGGATEQVIDLKTRELRNPGNNGLAVRVAAADRESHLRCACCDASEKIEGQIFKRALLGAPFLMGNIIPEMLRHVPRKNIDSLIGSRLITFTDSRQGTARFSAKLQLDSERKWCRSTIYRELARNSGSVDFENHPELKGLYELLPEMEGASLEAIHQQIEKKKLALGDNNFSLSWTEVVELLANSSEIQLMSGELPLSDDDMLPGEYQVRDDNFSQSKNLAHLFLLREFARRPKNANNLETLGLVKIVYPALEKISEEDLKIECRDWFSLGLNIVDWKNYLKVILDFYVRENTLVDIRAYQVNWIGGKLFARLLQGPEFDAQTEDEEKAIWAFPSVNKGTQHKLVRMLEVLSCKDSKLEPVLFNTILNFAWKTLCKLELLEFYQDSFREWRRGYHLKFENVVSFELTKSASLCPITNRWLDTTFRELSPYINGKTQIADASIGDKIFNIPHPEPELVKSESSSILRKWLNENKFVIEQKAEGVWRDVADAAILPPSLLRSAEHSAQQDSSKLKRFEKAFKKNFLNVLNCSTTMEMGVDIGALTIVAMNNAPPSPANYLQRAGRAGRRGESTSVVLTFCKATPHGERIFSEPKWPFDTPIPVPRVALESIPIVRRHINAYLLSTFLNNKLSKESLPKLKAGKFFISDTNVAVYERFCNWLENDALNDAVIANHLSILIQGSGLAGHVTSSLITHVIDTIYIVSKHWLSRYYAVGVEINHSVKNKENEDSNAAKGRLEKQLKDMESDYLLTVLAKRGFLPGYGFPINVVELVTNNKMEKWSDSKNGYPSRQLETAIREYSPGSDVVLNGAVYRSMGLQLSWQIPEQEIDLKKIQKLRHVRYCEDCGHSESDYLSLKRTQGDACPECDSTRLNIMEYIVPDGFKVDYKSPLHNDYTRPNYAPFVEPFISITDSDWQVLISPELGRFRVSDAGQLFHYNDGQGAGYALCWSCGRMDALKVIKSQGLTSIDTANLPPLLSKDSHNRLSGVSFDGKNTCDRHDWSIKVSSSHQDKRGMTPFVLGVDSTTSMFELQLRHPKSHEWIDDNTIIYSLGAALRQVFCKIKGISTNEIGLSVYRRKIGANDKAKVSSIFLYDTAEQGAGYSSSIPEILPQLLKKSFDYVKTCPSKCDAYCHACLLDYDTQHHISTLDRNQLIDFFNDTNIHERLEVEDGRQFFGHNSLPELSSAEQLVSLKGRASTSFDIFVSGVDWDVSQSRVINHIYSLRGCFIRLLLSKSVAESITPDLAWQLRKSLPDGVDIFIYESPELLSNEAFPILRMAFTDGEYWYATDDHGAVSLNAEWGETTRKSLVGIKQVEFEFTVLPFDVASLAMSSELRYNLALIDQIGTKIDVPFEKFGSALYALILENVPNLDDELEKGIERIIYSDRYLISPISIALISSLFSEINQQYGCDSFEIETSYPENRNNKTPYCIADNFNNVDEISAFLISLGESFGISIYSDYVEKNKLDHGRYLNIKLNSGKIIQLLFDQGMGYWSTRRPYGGIRFDFADPESEGTKLRDRKFDVKSTGGGSYIVVHEI